MDDKIEISVCYYIDEDTGKKVYDVEHMTDEFVEKIQKLTQEKE